LAPTLATKHPAQPAIPPTALERLHRDRAGLTSELAALNASSARLNEAANAEAAVLREIGAMGSVEIAAMTAWASGGCVGDQPTPDLKLRRTLGEKLAAAQAAATAAKGAGEDINHQISQHTERLALINDQIEQAIFDQVEHEHGDVISEYVGVCERGSQLATKISGLALLFRETGQNQRAAVIFATKLPTVSTNPREVQLAADSWGRRIADLRKGPAT
jgi:hypothetical protein